MVTDGEIKVSVVVPVYNVEQYLPQCLESLMRQTLREIEIICVNDGSTDDSAAILEEYAGRDPRIRVIHKENTGYGDTMNVGFSAAGGEYIGILESDDFAEPDMMETLYRTAKADRLDVVKANYYNYTEKGEVVNERLLGYPYRQVLSYRERPDVIRLTDSIWSALYRREFIREKEIFFHATPGASYQDTSFACQVWMHADRVEFIEDRLLHYRMDNMNSSINAPGKVFCICEEWHLVERLLEQYPEQKRILKGYQVATKYAGYLYNYHRLGACYQYALLTEIAKELKSDAENRYLEEACFTPEVWQQAEEIKRDADAFFLRTAKGVQDERMLRCQVKNYAAAYDGMVAEIRKYDHVVLYGAGRIGQKTAGLLGEMGISVTAFAVTQKDGNLDQVLGIPVAEIRQLEHLKENAIVIIAVKESSQYEIYALLRKLGYRNMLLIDRYWIRGQEDHI